MAKERYTFRVSRIFIVLTLRVCPTGQRSPQGSLVPIQGVVDHGGTAADMRLVGPKRGFCSRCFHTRRAGLYPVLASTFAERHSSYWFYSRFVEIFNAGKCGMESAEEVTSWVLNWD